MTWLALYWPVMADSVRPNDTGHAEMGAGMAAEVATELGAL